MNLKIYNKIIFMLPAVILFTINCFGQVGLNKLAQSTMNFQLVSISPRASAMGDAYYAVGTGAESIFYNPAGLAEQANTFNVVVDYTQWIADINYIGGAASWNLGNYGTVGISLLSVNYGTIYGTSLDPNSGSALGYIDNGTLSNVGAYSFGVGYAKAVSTQFSIGGNVRIAGQNLGENHFVDGTDTKNNASKLVFDVGVKYYTGFKNFRFGMAIRNFSSNIIREAVYEQLPLTFTVGTAIDLMDFINPEHSSDDALTFAVDFLHSNNYSERFNIGAEYKLLGMLALRGGYQTNRDIASWSLGIGVNKNIGGNEIGVNYSFSKMDVFKNINRLSVEFSL
jgi:hypothetical protein